MAGKQYLATAAIDFGTTFTGYAYSFTHELEKGQEVQAPVYVNQWRNTMNNSVTDKTPTSILFDQNQQFHSFGYDAEKKYVELSEDDEQTGWWFFKHFKMNLHNTKLHKDITIKDEQGKRMKAMDVFSQSIRFLSHHLYESIRKSRPDFQPEDIFWVITVPGVWKYNAKVFMKEAALKAELANDRLAFVHEPEAAAILISELKLMKDVDNQGHAVLKALDTGTRFVLLDLGGGTIDIFACEIQEDRSLTELCPRGGGHWGGTRVDDNIHKSIKAFFGNNIFQEFKKNNYEDFFLLSVNIQTAKCSIDKTRTDVRLRLPESLRTLLSGEGHTSAQLSVIKDKLRIPMDDMIEAFRDSKTLLVGAVGDLLQSEELADIDTVIMVGGFAESLIMQEAIAENFPRKTLIVPEQANTVVLRGAVLYGFNQDILHSRILPFTIGICTVEQYVEGRHPAGCVTRNGKVDDVFKIFLRKGTNTQSDNTVVQQSVMSGLYGANVEIYLTTTDNLPDPSFTTDPVFEQIGAITIPVETKEMIDIKISVGHFAISAKAKTHRSTEWRDVSFDYL